MVAGMNNRAEFSGRALRAFGFAIALLMVSISMPAMSLEVIDSSGGEIYVEVGKGRLLRLDEAPATVFLADPKIADIQFRSTKMVYVVGNATGETSLYALDKRDRVLLNRKIVVGYDLEQLGKAIEQLIPNSGVTASMVNSTLVLDGVVGSPAEAEAVRELAKSMIGGGKMLNRIKVSMANQVNLRVIIAEVSRSVVKNLGIETDVLGSGFGFSTALASGNANVISSVSRTVGSVAFDVQLEALETEGLLKVLAEPNLTALSGETASFLAGGEFPVAGQRDNNGNVAIEFKPFGVSLSFTPTLLDESRISLKVRPEVSQLSSQGAVIIDGQPVSAVSTRRTETTVELGNGESLSIAGLLQRNDQQDLSKVPGLGDIPILGALFRSDSYRRNETELVIVVTPYIVRPTAERIALPSDGYETANDFERYVSGIPYRDTHGSVPDRVATSGGQRLVGGPGFQKEHVK
jgi:pilus assembly protein CpaC